jgi:hypothetical protein
MFPWHIDQISNGANLVGQTADQVVANRLLDRIRMRRLLRRGQIGRLRRDGIHDETIGLRIDSKCADSLRVVAVVAGTLHTVIDKFDAGVRIEGPGSPPARQIDDIV